MKERPILFSGEMVRAILEGRKTQTRRVAKEPIYVDLLQVVRSDIPIPHEHIFARPGRYRAFLNDLGAASVRSEHPRGLLGVKPGEFQWVNSYGQIADRLWVRETLRRDPDANVWYYAAGKPEDWVTVARENHSDSLVWAHHKEGDVCVSIHMPRWASRITLEVVKVRVERVQEISEADALAEGIHEFILPNGPVYGYDPHGTPGTDVCDTARLAYAALWDKINAKRGFGWDKNPWVWVIEFRRV